jgi:hypothetical protein
MWVQVGFELWKIRLYYKVFKSPSSAGDKFVTKNTAYLPIQEGFMLLSCSHQLQFLYKGI